mmetsp:Transcript_26348/g.59470  ORF Transcript_26348/g.59470 Transcript_26348/m.59470 type:complete len:426 (+) Transcript_26348:2-1279(+)
MAAPAEGASCSSCYEPIKQLRRCGVCKKAAYCSTKCQKEDWKFHSRVCKKPPPQDESQAPKTLPGMEPDSEDMKRQLDEITKGQDPAFAAQVEQMMAGMMGIETKKEPMKEPDVPCQNCRAPCTKPLRCGVCKTATYCSANCQKEDWRFHKRLCKKPTAPPAAAAAEPAEKAPPMRPKENESMVVNEDVGTWYKHREWKPEDARKEFAPSKLDSAQGSQAASASSVAGSVWNAAGTWEEKAMLPWWQQRIQKLQGLADGEALEITKVSPLQGEASIVHVRGQPKFMYDLTFDLSFSGLQTCKVCAKSPGSRCSNCIRFKGKIKVSDLCWDSEGAVSLRVNHEEADGPSHVKKASIQQCCEVANAQLVPAVRAFLDECVAEYKATESSDGPKWASQLPPSSAPGKGGGPETVPAPEPTIAPTGAPD